MAASEALRFFNENEALENDGNICQLKLRARSHVSSESTAGWPRRLY
jgi:hypothetical protein